MKGKVEMNNSNFPKSRLAITSLILGIVSWIPGLGILLGIIAIVLGVIAISQIKKRPFGGKGLAKRGIVLGCLGIIFTLIETFFWYLATK